MEPTEASGRLTRWEHAESLLVYRRELASKIIVAMIEAAALNRGVLSAYHTDPAAEAEDLANAITERLAARETGDPNGYK